MQTPKDLNELVKHMVEFMEQQPQATKQTTFEHLFNLISPGIKLRYEIIHQESKNVETTEKKKPFEYLDSVDVKRVILTSDRLKGDFKNLLTQQCNGVVLEYPTWNVLSVPPMMFNPKFNVKFISKNLNQYTFYKAVDGTVVTLYYYNNNWCMSSSNGYEINKFQWMGDKTYEQALRDVLNKYPDFSFDKLDKRRCYTIGFRHSDFHPLLSDPASAWFIQSTEIDNSSEHNFALSTSDDIIGLPLQTKVVIETQDQFYNALTQCNNALNNYMNSVRRNDGKDISALSINYGLVIRGNFTTLGASANIFIESELMKKIRQLMYNLPKDHGRNQINHSNRMEYTILRAYLNYTSARYMFINLFPQFAPQYEKYSNIISKIVNRITQSYRNKTVRDAISSRANGLDKTKKNNSQSVCIDKLAAAFIDHLSKNERINVFDPQSKNIIHDYIVDPKYVNIYFDIITAA